MSAEKQGTALGQKPTAGNDRFVASYVLSPGVFIQSYGVKCSTY